MSDELDIDSGALGLDHRHRIVEIKTRRGGLGEKGKFSKGRAQSTKRLRDRRNLMQGDNSCLTERLVLG